MKNKGLKSQEKKFKPQNPFKKTLVVNDETKLKMKS